MSIETIRAREARAAKAMALAGLPPDHDQRGKDMALLLAVAEAFRDSDPRALEDAMEALEAAP